MNKSYYYYFLPDNAEMLSCKACAECEEIFSCSWLSLTDFSPEDLETTGKYYEVEYSNEIVGEDDLAANRGFKNTRSHCIKYIPHSLGHSFSLSPHCHNCHKCNVVTCWHNRKSISEAEEPKKYNKTEIIAREISKGEYFSKKGKQA